MRAAGKLICVDPAGAAITARWRVLEGVAANRTFVAGLLAIGATMLAYIQARRIATSDSSSKPMGQGALSLLVASALLIVWLPTFEIVRAFRYESLRESFADAELAMHVAPSVYWSLNATVMLIIGFARRLAALRHLAIGLFVVTLLKVFIFDLSQLEMMYRIISFAVLGVLMLFASLLYQRLSSRILSPGTTAAPLGD